MAAHHVLSLIVRRPEMYFATTESERHLDAFEHFICGYALACDHHRLSDYVEFETAFREFLKPKYADESKSPYRLIRNAASSADEAWNELGRQLEAFSTSRAT